jgi:hypothetical protein
MVCSKHEAEEVVEAVVEVGVLFLVLVQMRQTVVEEVVQGQPLALSGFLLVNL